MSEQRPLPTKRTLEAALVGAGLSNKQAKRLLSGGYAAIASPEVVEAAELIDLLEQMQQRLRRSA